MAGSENRVSTYSVALTKNWINLVNYTGWWWRTGAGKYLGGGGDLYL